MQTKNRKINYQLSYLTVLLAFAFLTATTSAQSGATFVIQKSVIASGGSQSSGDIFILNGTEGESWPGWEAYG